ncbi:MAG: hypothetical protein O7D34_04850 [Ignavibacteria bacterium]|nr:hypothetical protein [Ignavibacteria bacterium]
MSGCVGSYPYVVMNDGCLCERFVQNELGGEVVYIFSAKYRVDESISTTIEVEIHNNSLDTVDLSNAHIKVSSRNVQYQYNDRFLPVTISFIPPGEQRTLILTGESVGRTGDDLWLKIAGEELIVTLKDVYLGQQKLSRQAIKLVPHNPKLRS